MTGSRILTERTAGVVGAPMAGGPSTPELAAAVTRAGGLGMLAAGYRTADQMREQIGATRELLGGEPFGVNLFVPEVEPTFPRDLDAFRPAWERGVAALDSELGEQAASAPAPEGSDDDWAAKLEALRSDPVPVVSLTFGLPPADAVRVLQEAGSEVWIGVSAPGEAVRAAMLRPDALVVQSADAGGHRFTLDQRAVEGPQPLPELLEAVRTVLGRMPGGAEDAPSLIAAGGIATAEAAAAARRAGALAVQAGTALLACPEAGTGELHRTEVLRVAALARGEGGQETAIGAPDAAGERTAVTRIFSGRPARSLRTPLMQALAGDQIEGYPQVNTLTSPLRRAAAATGRPELTHLWAGRAVAECRAEPAADVVARLA